MEQRTSTLYLFPILFDRYKMHVSTKRLSALTSKGGNNAQEKARRLKSTYYVLLSMFLQNGLLRPKLCPPLQLRPQSPVDASYHGRPVVCVACP